MIDPMSAAVVDVFGGLQPDPRMMMLTVVPIEKGAAKLVSILKTAESFWELRPILQGLKLRFRERVVIGDVRARMSLSHAQLSEQLSDEGGPH